MGENSSTRTCQKCFCPTRPSLGVSRRGTGCSSLTANRESTTSSHTSRVSTTEHSLELSISTFKPSIIFSTYYIGHGLLLKGHGLIGVQGSTFKTADKLKWHPTSGNPVQLFTPLTLSVGQDGSNCFLFHTSDKSIQDASFISRAWGICIKAGCIEAGQKKVLKITCITISHSDAQPMTNGKKAAVSPPLAR